MNIVKQEYHILTPVTNPMRHIERIARVCYKSEDKICDGSDVKIVRKLYNNKHMAMLEHFRFILSVNTQTYELLEKLELKYFNMTKTAERNLVSFNARALIEMVERSNCENHGIMPMVVVCLRDEFIAHIVNRYGCYELFGKTDIGRDYATSQPIYIVENERSHMTAEEWTAHGWMSVLFTVDRGVSHEMVRMRECSFAQESTRYCNYGNLDGGITVILPQYLEGKSMVDASYATWYNAMCMAQDCYLALLNNNVAPQDARGVLPHNLKVDMVVTTNVKEWLHIFELRALGTTGKPHPMMVQVMMPLFQDMIKQWYIKDDKTAELGLKIGGDWQYE